MVEPVTTGALVLGAGWFANKLLGPSADATGGALKTYGSDRLKTIFDRAAKKLKPEEVIALPPGFTINYLQKAKFSEDDETITDLWSNLLAAASTNFSNRHVAYVEILSQLTAFDAITAEGLVPEKTFYNPQMSKPVNLRIELILKLARDMRNISDSKEQAQDELYRLLRLDLRWPGRITSARLHFRDGEKILPISGGASDQFASYDNLSRLGLIERFDFDNSMETGETAVEGVLVTMLGIGFIQTCRGRR